MADIKEIQFDSAQDPNLFRKFNPALFKTLLREAGGLKNKKVIHINATARGGGVAEMLQIQVPLERALGLDSRWLVINAPNDFFVITKKMHNLIQGGKNRLTEDEKSYYLKTNRELGGLLARFVDPLEHGTVVIHDPQPLPLIAFVPSSFDSFLRIHIDLTSPDTDTWEFLKPLIERYSLVIVSSEEYAKPFDWFDKSKIKVIMPAINPLSDKNKKMAVETAKTILAKWDINPDKPLIAQVSRFDPWKDPMGVINAYYIAKNSFPDLQLIMAGIMQADDDPEAKELFKSVEKHAAGDPDIFLFSHPDMLGEVSNDVFINAVQTASDLVIQKSLREGFGLTVTEAMWKGKAVVAGKTVGTDMQINDGVNGFLVASVEETAEAILKLLRDPALAAKLGQKAWQTVKEKFLLPRLVLDHLKLYRL